MRITKPLNSSAYYDKTELTVVPKCPSILQLTYPAVSAALTKDFKFIEAQMEVEIMDSNEQNADFVSNLQERIIVQENLFGKIGACHEDQIHHAPNQPILRQTVYMPQL
jgi:hypothetical protein